MASLLWLGGLHAEPFIRGDADGSGGIETADAVRVFRVLFLGGPDAACADTADVDDSGELDITDGIAIAGFLFTGASAPPAPFPDCGFDTTEDTLGCKSSGSCADAEGGGAALGFTLHVEVVSVAFFNVGGPNRLGVAHVRVEDELGNPVNGALVRGDWSGCVRQNGDSAVTQTFYNEDGTVWDEGVARILADKKRSCWGNNPCSFVFTVTDVSMTLMAYDPASNVENDSSTPCF